MKVHSVNLTHLHCPLLPKWEVVEVPLEFLDAMIVHAYVLQEDNGITGLGGAVSFINCLSVPQVQQEFTASSDLLINTAEYKATNGQKMHVCTTLVIPACSSKHPTYVWTSSTENKVNRWKYSTLSNTRSDFADRTLCVCIHGHITKTLSY